MANKRRPQGDGTIRKRSDGRWEARIIIGHKNDGSPMYKSAFAKTQKSALKQLHQLLDLYRDVDLTEDRRMTLGEWMDKWLDEYMIFTFKKVNPCESVNICVFFSLINNPISADCSLTPARTLRRNSLSWWMI